MNHIRAAPQSNFQCLCFCFHKVLYRRRVILLSSSFFLCNSLIIDINGISAHPDTFFFLLECIFLWNWLTFQTECKHHSYFMHYTNNRYICLHIRKFKCTSSHVPASLQTRHTNISSKSTALLWLIEALSPFTAQLFLLQLSPIFVESLSGSTARCLLCPSLAH